MTVVDSIKIAFLVALFGRELQKCLEPSSHAGRDVYGTASCRRLERWKRELQEKKSGGYVSNSDISLLEEILLAEPLTRVWAAVYASREKVSDGFGSPESVFHEHLAVRRHAMEISTVGAACEKLRRQSERWSDLALACLQSRLVERVLSPQDYMIDVRRGEDYGFISAQHRLSENDPRREREGEQVAGVLKRLEAAYPNGVFSEDDATRYINETVMESLQGLVPSSNVARVAFWDCRIDQASDIMV